MLPVNARPVADATPPAARPAGDAPIRPDDAAAGTRYLLGDWVVDTAARRLSRGDRVVVLEPRPMAVLAHLCRRPGEVVAAEALLEACWPGEPTGDNPVHKVMAGLRRALEDSATEPRCIETIRKRGYRLVAPVRVLSTEGERSLTRAWRGQSPFCGLAPFGPGHASVFFGRDAAIADLRARLATQRARGRPLVLLLGPSGSGKSSLAQAGLVPSRPSGRAATLHVDTVAGQGPWEALAGALLDWEADDVPLLSGYSVETLAATLRDAPAGAWRDLRIGLEAAAGPPPLLVLDRLEALFQAPADRHAADLLACIGTLVDDGAADVLAVCRNDFYPSLARWPLLMRDKEQGAHMDLAAPDADAIAQMIRLPARAAGLVFGSDASGLQRLDDRLCADAVRAPDALPLLQYTLQALYQERGPGDELPWDAYEAMGGLEGAVGRRAEALLADQPPARQAALARVLPRLVAQVSDDAAPSGRRVAWTELADPEERALVHALVEARLLVSDHVAGAPGVRVAHEALLRRWPRVTAWVARHRASLAVREDVRSWRRRWHEAGRPGNLLLPRGPALWQAGRALETAPDLFDAGERAFVEASQVRARRRTRLRWAATLGAVALAAVSGVAAAWSARLAREAAEHERQSQRLASFMLGDLADQLRPLGRLDLLARIGDQGVEVLGHAGRSAEAPLDALQRARALAVVGEVNSSRGKGRTAIALEALHQARQVLVSIPPGQVPVADLERAQGTTAFWLGQIAFDAGRLDEASRWMAAYRDACTRWRAAAPADAEAGTELGQALGSLGAVAMRRGAWSEAEATFREALQLKSARLAARPDDPALRASMATTVTWLGQLAFLRGSPDEALAAYARARALRLPARGTPDATTQHALAILSEREAEALRAAGRRDEGLRALAAGIAVLADDGRRDPQNRWWAAELAHARARLLLDRAEAGQDPSPDLAALRARLDDPAFAGPQVGSLVDVARLHVALAEALRPGPPRIAESGPPADADAGARRALDLGLQVLGRRPDAWQADEGLARLVLWRLDPSRGGARAPAPAGFCAAARDGLAPAVRAGQAGVVRAAWQSASRCADAAAPTTSDGRRPAGADPSSPAAAPAASH